MNHVLVGAPTYDGTRYNSIALARLLRGQAPDTLVNLVEFSGSVLTYSFNALWAAALNLRAAEVPVTHFLLLHADIQPEQDNWLEIMLNEMARTKAEVLSAVVPIKNDKGLTSTAWDTDPWLPLRFSTTEIEAIKEPTWTQPDLLINTGLLLVDFTKPWVEKIVFHMHDTIVKDASGRFQARFAPEDWDFSRQCHALGIPVYATKAVTVGHVGRAVYSSRNVWGYPTDLASRTFEFEAERPTEVVRNDQPTEAD